jgi:hypothetical protein
MRTLCVNTVCGALLAIGLVSCATAPEQKQAIELFNGKDLNGWSYVLADPKVKMEDVWSVQNGILVCKGEPIGVLYRGPEVTNFRMVVEYRWTPGQKPGNSGIFSRINKPVTPLPAAFECQLMHGSAGDLIGLQGRKVASGQERFLEVKAHPVAGDITGVKKLSDQEKPAGEWNKVEILAEGPRYQVWVNGQLVNDVQGVDVSSGPVGVQSEGGMIEFRRVSLTPLD